jgi:hypothetical protein
MDDGAVMIRTRRLFIQDHAFPLYPDVEKYRILDRE